MAPKQFKTLNSFFFFGDKRLKKKNLLFRDKIIKFGLKFIPCPSILKVDPTN